MHMTVGGDLVTMQVGTIHTLDTLAERDLTGFEVLRAHPVCGHLWADTPATVVACPESVGYLNLLAALDDPARVVAELYAPNGGDRVVVLTNSGVANIGVANIGAANEDGATAATVLLDIVEARDGRSP